MRIAITKAELTPEIMKRFWLKVHIPNDITQCWEWLAYKNKKGYGKFSLYHGCMIYATRISYIYYYGDIDSQLNLCHHCDNPGCVNPNHLFLGTQYDNLQDMVNKNRSCKGSKNNTNLTESDIIQMLMDIFNNKYHNRSEILLKYNISRTALYNILNGRTWTHITTNFPISLNDLKLKLIK